MDNKMKVIFDIVVKTFFMWNMKMYKPFNI